MDEPDRTPFSATANRSGIRVNPPVFFISATLIILFVLFGALFTERAARLFAALQSLIIIDFGWFYVVAVAGFLLFVLFLMCSRYGDVKLGPDESEPEYSYFMVRDAVQRRNGHWIALLRGR